MKHRCAICDCRRNTTEQSYCPICMARHSSRQPASKMISSERIREIRFQMESMSEDNIPIGEKYKRISELSGIPHEDIEKLDPDTILSRARQYNPLKEGWSGKVIHSKSKQKATINNHGLSNIPLPTPAPTQRGFAGGQPQSPPQGFTNTNFPTPTPAQPKPKRGWATNPLTDNNDDFLVDDDLDTI